MNPNLYREARRLIAQLEMISHAPTRNWESDGRGGGDPSRPPTNGHTPPPRDSLGRELDDYEPAFLVLRRRFRAASTDSELEQIIKVAKEELARAKRTAPPPVLEKGTVAWRRAIANDDRPAAEVARVFDVSRKHVYRLREQYREKEAA